MSRFASEKLNALEAYTPGEQPRDMTYIKLNTNESPYPPSPAVLAAVDRGEVENLRLYSDPEGADLCEALAVLYDLAPENVFLSNGSDDILNFAFWAFGGDGAVFPAITYSFYPVFCQLHGIAMETVPLEPDWTIDPAKLADKGKLTVLANPNAPTGIALSPEEIETIVASNPHHVVVVDEAYVDFGAKSVYPLVEKYDNLLVVMTYSKSRSLAGARLGFALGNAGLIADLNKLKYATNPYNVNRLTLAIGKAAVESQGYFDGNAQKIIRTRAKTVTALEKMGFQIPPSQANFIFITKPGLDGAVLYQKLKARGVLIRHFSQPALAQYNRVTIGTDQEMETFLAQVTEILVEEGTCCANC